MTLEQRCAIFRNACIRRLQGGHEELFQVYYCILPLPEDLALKQNNNKGFAIFHCKVHVIEVAGSFEREDITMNISAAIITTGQTFMRRCI